MTSSGNSYIFFLLFHLLFILFKFLPFPLHPLCCSLVNKEGKNVIINAMSDLVFHVCRILFFHSGSYGSIMLYILKWFNEVYQVSVGALVRGKKWCIFFKLK